MQIDAPEPEPANDTHTPEPAPTVSSTSFSTFLPDSPFVPESSHIPTSHDPELHVDFLPHSMPSSPFSEGFQPSLTSGPDVEPDIRDTVSTCSLPDSSQDSRLSPASESVAISDTVSPCQSPSSFHFALFDACGLPGPTPSHDDIFLSAQPVPALRDSDSIPSTQSLPPEAPSVSEVGANGSIQSSAGESFSGEVSDTRHQEPPFMTDGRGRVVWSCSGVKRGSSPLAIRGQQDRTPSAAGERE